MAWVRLPDPVSSGLSLLLVPSLCSKGFCPGSLILLPPQKPTFQILIDLFFHILLLDYFHRLNLAVRRFTLSDQIFCVPRCNCVSLVDGISENAAAKAWEQRWVRACVCGGSWRKLPFKEQQNVTAAAAGSAATTTTAAVCVAGQ